MAHRSKKSNNKLLLLASLTFLLVSTSALSLHTLLTPPGTVTVMEKSKSKLSSIPPLPVLGVQTDALEPVLTAPSVIALDLGSGVTLFEKNADEELFPASTTKIVTALVALDVYALDEVVTIGSMNVVGQKMGLTEGEQLTVQDLLEGMLIYSANDAAEALALHYPDGRLGFIDAMNRKVRQLHADHSHFMNPSGLENWQHFSTARDMARLAGAAIENPTFAAIVATKKTTVVSLDGSKKHSLTNINKLLESVEGVLGVKTGWTEHAKENLITYVDRNDRRVVIALLGSDDRFGETKSLIDWIYGNFSWEKVILP